MFSTSLRGFILVLLLVLFHVEQVQAQQKPKMDLADLLDQWVASPQDTFLVEGVELQKSKFNQYIKGYSKPGTSAVFRYLDKKYGGQLTSDQSGILKLDKSLHLKNIKSPPLFISNLDFDNLIISDSELTSLRFDSLFVDQLSLTDVSLEQNLAMGYSSVRESIRLAFDAPGSSIILKSALPPKIIILNSNLESFTISDSWSQELNPRLVWVEEKVQWGTSFNPKINMSDFVPEVHTYLLKSQFDFIRIGGNKINSFSFYYNTMPNHDLSLYSDFGKLNIEDSKLAGISLTSNTRLDELTIENNEIFQWFILEKILSEVNFDINWPDIKGRMAMREINKYTINDTLFLPTSDRAVEEMSNYKWLAIAYSSLYNNYKQSGLTEFMNECYIEWKDMETARLKHLYQSNRTFESYFRLKLNQLLKSYVSYGTNPAKSIVITTYIILIFALIYLLFPSDWDVSSKSKLLEITKDLIRKNDKGYMKPLLILLYSILVSVVNAFTLSLNSFVTLGFGKIPTQGIARYICILEGFIGWFLLSLFTVSLINQVLI